MKGLAEVFREHMSLGTSRRYVVTYGIGPDDFEAAVLDWIRERLAGAREDVLTAVAESVRETNYLGDQAEPDEITDAALTAVAGALGVGDPS